MRLAALLLPAAGLGCAGGAGEGSVVDDSLYVEIMTRLVVVRDSMDEIRLPYWSQQQALDSVEAAVETEYGVTADDLFRFARSTGRDAERMKRLWETIGARVDSIRPEDSAPEDSAAEEAASRRAAARRTGS